MPRADVAIVVPLKEEFRELRGELRRLLTELDQKRTEDGVFYWFERATENRDRPHRCVVTFVGTAGEVDAALLTRDLLAYEPLTVVVVGIAAGTRDARLGDVVVASVVDRYLENGAAVAGTEGARFDLERGGEPYRTTRDLVRYADHFEFGDDRFDDWLAQCSKDRDASLSLEVRRTLMESRALNASFGVFTGHVASGPIVGKTTEFVAWLRERDRRYEALEMESGGVLAACRRARSPATLILRGISDYGDEGKATLEESTSGNLRGLAVRNAIRLLWKFFDVFEQHPDEAASRATSTDLHPSSVSRSVFRLGTLAADNPTYVRRAADGELERIADEVVREGRSRLVFLHGASESGKSSMKVRVPWSGHERVRLNLSDFHSGHRGMIQERLAAAYREHDWKDVTRIVSATVDRPGLLELDEFGVLRGDELVDVMLMLHSLIDANLCVIACAIEHIEQALGALRTRRRTWVRMWTCIDLDRQRLTDDGVRHVVGFLPEPARAHALLLASEITRKCAGLPGSVQALCMRIEKLVDPSEGAVRELVRDFRI